MIQIVCSNYSILKLQFNWNNLISKIISTNDCPTSITRKTNFTESLKEQEVQLKIKMNKIKKKHYRLFPSNEFVRWSRN